MEDFSADEGVPSSPSDFYSSDTNRDTIAVSRPSLNPNMDSLSGKTSDPPDEDEVDQSSSEMDLSSDAGMSSPEPVSRQPVRALLPAVQAQKRKAEDIGALSPDEFRSPETAKRPKTVQSPGLVSGFDGTDPVSVGPLPAELWQQVFLRLSPAMLCRCLRVCKSFRFFLTGAKAFEISGPKLPGPSKVHVMDSDTIWSHVRKLHLPNLPRPLKGRTDLEMLQLVGAKHCQLCGRFPIPAAVTNPFSAGPGPDGVRVAWAFGVRTCGRCLQSSVIRDVDILVSSEASLRQGLPYAFVTPELHLIPDLTRQLPGGIPSQLRASKVYHKRDVDAISRDFEIAKSLGEGAAEEWRKGLGTMGKERMADAARWEKWASQMASGSDLGEVLREYDLTSFPRHLDGMQSRSAGVTSLQLASLMNGSANSTQPTTQRTNGSGTPSQGPGEGPYSVSQLHRHDRRVAEEVRQARRLDIERRCQGLEPPLHPDVLQHMNAFQAAIQITRPMTDQLWELLKPRILAEREDAELLEHQRKVQLAALCSAIREEPVDPFHQRTAREHCDHEYEQVQEPLRRKLGEYAEDFINGQWRGSRGLTRRAAALFATQCLLFVRKRYYEDQLAHRLSRPARRTGSEWSEQESTVSEPFLSLDNMKWVHEAKVRPLTDSLCRELFLCSGCAEDKHPKWFAFEGLIQHYGAKHTTSFSKGNIVVHWQTARWPDEPPFVDDPTPWLNTVRKSEYPKDRRNNAWNTPQTGYHDPGALSSAASVASEPAQFHQKGPPSQGSDAYSFELTPFPKWPGATYPEDTSSQAQPAAPSFDVSNEARVDRLVSEASTIWAMLDGVPDMLDCVKLTVVLHHVVENFSGHYKQKPELDLLTEALASNPRVFPLKHASGLACKACVAHQYDGSHASQSYYTRLRGVKLYNLSSLITHFKILHLSKAPHLDWCREMIEVPEAPLISGLVNKAGMDDDKLALVAAAFPSAFPTPLPKIGTVSRGRKDLTSKDRLVNNLIKRFVKQEPSQRKKKTGSRGQDGASAHDGSSNDEYDPTNPMLVKSKAGEFDPSRFDTDLARSKALTPARIDGDKSGLTVEKLAAQNAYTTSQAPVSHPSSDESRTPSVGRAESPRVHCQTAQLASTRAEDARPAAAPDITAILASLTNQAYLSPRAQVSMKGASWLESSGASQQAHAEFRQPSQAASLNPLADARRSSGYYAPGSEHGHFAALPSSGSSYQGRPATLSQSGMDLHAALSYNQASHETNQQPAYPERPYPAVRASPPRYYVYEDTRPAPPPLRSGDPATIQYVQREPVMEYRYDQAPPPKRVYVDEYGRQLQLVPIDSAPAPVQYLPHPYEVQHHPRLAHARAQPPPLYFEQPARTAPAQAYVYDDGARSSVPRS